MRALLDKQLSDLPTTGYIDTAVLAERLANRPLSDVAFVIREGARLAARGGKYSLDQESLNRALDSAPPRDSSNDGPRRVGFM